MILIMSCTYDYFAEISILSSTLFLINALYYSEKEITGMVLIFRLLNFFCFVEKFVRI